LTKAQKRSLKKQKQKQQLEQSNGKQTEENKAKEEAAPKEAQPKEENTTENNHEKPETPEKKETVIPSDGTPKAKETPTKAKNTNEKNGGAKDDEKPILDSKDKQKQQSQQQKKGVEKKLGNGIEIKDIKVGNGPEIKQGQLLHIMFAGQLADKTVFDKQLTGSGFAYKFGSEEGIKGWHLGMKGMKVGGKRRIVIPPKFAFGVDGDPAKKSSRRCNCNIYC